MSNQPEPKTAPLANPFTAFDPMSMFAATQQAFARLMTDAFERAESMSTQYAQLTHDALSYSAQLASEARKLGFDSLRRATAA